MDEAQAQVRVANGQSVTAHADHAIGSFERPMTDAALEDKLASLAEGVLTRAKTTALIAQLWSLDRLDDASTLARAAARGA
jgi:hypothetical protein